MPLIRLALLLSAVPCMAQTTPPAGDMAQAAQLRDAQRLTEALAIYERILAQDPADDGAYRMRVLTLAELGNSQLALEGLQQRSHLFPLHERERIEGDRVARGIVWGATRQVDQTLPYDESAHALAALRTLQEQAPRQTTWEATRLRVDALSALNHMRRDQEVADSYQALLNEGIEVPAYILPAVGDSLLALRRPADAVPVLEAAHTHAPGNAVTRILLGYAWLEQERFDLAMPYFERLAAEQQAWPRIEGAKSGYENWDKYSADLSLALAHSFANDTALAERELQALGDTGPHNAGLQTAIGTIQARRMRPQAAMERYDMALTLNPYERAARVGKVETWLTLAQPDRASAGHAALRAEHPRDVRLDRLDTQLQRYRGWQLQVNAGRARSEPRGDGTSASPFGSRDGRLGFRLESPLIGDRWRLGVTGRDDWADFQGERVRYRALGAGASYRYDRLGASAYVTRAQDDYDDGGTGLELLADWRFSDAWRGHAAYQRNDPEASLQARRFGITADSFGVGTTWTPSDYTHLGLRAAHYRYDDGNRRSLLGADLSQRLVSRPHLIVEGLAGASTSRASRGDQVAYFNPEHDASLTAGLRAEHITWRRYERGFRQRLEATVGPYWQEGYGSHWVPAVAYRHIWDFGIGSRLEYGVNWSRPVYDGNREQRIGFDVTYRWGTAP